MHGAPQKLDWSMLSQASPVVTRVFWPPLTPRITLSPTSVSRHSCHASCFVSPDVIAS